MARITINVLLLIGVILCIRSNGFKSRMPAPLVKRASIVSMATTQIPTKSPIDGGWSPDSWKKLPIKQPPNYPDQVIIYIYSYKNTLIYLH